MLKRVSTTLLLKAIMISVLVSCSNKKTETDTATTTTGTADSSMSNIKLITLDPGHFHAALVQKTMYSQVDPTVHVYAPAGDDLQEHLKKIEGYNTRSENPTKWKEEVYTGQNYLEKMLNEKKGNVVVMAGNNQKKTQYIKASVDAGLHVLADKPMAINTESFNLLKDAFASAEKNNVLLYDIMTERYEITTILQREFSMLPEVFGTLQKGTSSDPAITKESVHHVFKYVSGAPLKRPAWFFDVSQQGEGIVDVTTHLVDLVQWECFPEQTINYQNDIKISNARHWKTNLTPTQFRQVTQLKTYPDYLKKDLSKDSLLGIYANGEINYQIKGINAKVSVIWNYQAPEGAGDTHYSMMKGTKANLVIRQGKEQNYKPLLYIEPAKGTDLAAFEATLKTGLAKVQSKYPGIEIKKAGNIWSVIAPEKYHNGHEAHFGQVTEKYLQFLADGKMPAWEVPNMLAKYYTTTKALEMAKQGK
ncbi:putative oxidoreductase C-terminal domain-containing protein [Adhaeribacter aquaticus]|uniref:putative oxidoreductase C-terminal domain-containing protein n=1 Tax=Adhaeribacter aquaticus TaxID=299567 RepID=UPI0004794B18|nr:putative oxidoreductase C-terminal domain-containing protein [Adhaeribacter aquaticus]